MLCVMRCSQEDTYYTVQPLNPPRIHPSMEPLHQNAQEAMSFQRCLPELTPAKDTVAGHGLSYSCLLRLSVPSKDGGYPDTAAIN